MVNILSNNLLAALLVGSIALVQSIPTSVLVDTKDGQASDSSTAQTKREYDFDIYFVLICLVDAINRPIEGRNRITNVCNEISYLNRGVRSFQLHSIDVYTENTSILFGTFDEYDA